jgi:hypothetical protein
LKFFKLSQCNSTVVITIKKCLVYMFIEYQISHCNFEMAQARAWYSYSEEDLAMRLVHFLDFWQMRESPRKRHQTLIDLRVSEHPPNWHCCIPEVEEMKSREIKCLC